LFVFQRLLIEKRYVNIRIARDATAGLPDRFCATLLAGKVVCGLIQTVSPGQWEGRLAKRENKTTVTAVSPVAFIASLDDGPRRRDAERLLTWMTEVTGLKPQMWGAGLIGFGRYAYTYDSGHSGEAMMTGFSPRKANMVVYVMPGFDGFEGKLARLGKHKTGASCLYLGALDTIDMDVLAEIVREGLDHVRATYETWDA